MIPNHSESVSHEQHISNYCKGTVPTIFEVGFEEV